MGLSGRTLGARVMAFSPNNAGVPDEKGSGCPTMPRDNKTVRRATCACGKRAFCTAPGQIPGKSVVGHHFRPVPQRFAGGAPGHWHLLLPNARLRVVCVKNICLRIRALRTAGLCRGARGASWGNHCGTRACRGAATWGLVGHPRLSTVWRTVRPSFGRLPWLAVAPMRLTARAGPKVVRQANGHQRDPQCVLGVPNVHLTTWHDNRMQTEGHNYDDLQALIQAQGTRIQATRRRCEIQVSG